MYIIFVWMGKVVLWWAFKLDSPLATAETWDLKALFWGLFSLQSNGLGHLFAAGRLISFMMWHYITGWVVPDIRSITVPSYFGLHFPEDYGTVFLQNGRRYTLTQCHIQKIWTLYSTAMKIANLSYLQSCHGTGRVCRLLHEVLTSSFVVSVYLFVHPLGSTLLPLERFSWNTVRHHF